jgi:hypothetical protein
MGDDTRADATMTRRCLLGCAGKLAAGTAALALGGGSGILPAAAAKEAPTPWPYRKLDPEQVGALTYDRWYTGLCMNAVLTGLVTPLRASVGEPWASFPVDAFVWGHGGVVGWGTMCGSILGASVAANLVCGAGPMRGGEQVVNELVHFYAETELPTFKPGTPRLAAVPAPSRSESPLCHVSVGKWMKKTNRGFLSPERRDRCARLSANVAMQTARYLNAFAEGTFKPQHRFPVVLHDITAQANCTECHRGTVPEPATTGNP